MSELEARGPEDYERAWRPAVRQNDRRFYSGLTPAARTAGTHLSIEALSCAPSASGVASWAVGRSTASSVRRTLIFSSESVATSAWLSLATTSFGVPLGAKKPFQIVTS